MASLRIRETIRTEALPIGSSLLMVVLPPEEAGTEVVLTNRNESLKDRATTGKSVAKHDKEARNPDYACFTFAPAPGYYFLTVPAHKYMTPVTVNKHHEYIVIDLEYPERQPAKTKARIVKEYLESRAGSTIRASKVPLRIKQDGGPWVSRSTVYQALKVLEAEGRAEQRMVGRNTLWYIKPPHQGRPE